VLNGQTHSIGTRRKTRHNSIYDSASSRQPRK
jgi:hypothetical protein